MEPYFVGDRVRPQGQASLELYVVPDPDIDTELTALLDHAAAVLERFPAVALTPPHMTLVIYSCQANRMVEGRIRY